MFKLFYVFAQDSVFSSGSSIFTDGIHSKYLYYCCICKFLKELLSIVSFETWCKGKDFYFYLPNIFRSFFDLFFRKFFRNDFRTFAWIFQPHPSVSIFPGSLTSLSSCHHRISLDCGCKSTAVKHIIQIFLQLFYNYFLLSLIVSDLQMHFSPFFWLPLFLFYFSFLNSQFSILLSQLTKSRRIFTNSRRLFSKRRRLFLFLCLPF